MADVEEDPNWSEDVPNLSEEFSEAVGAPSDSFGVRGSFLGGYRPKVGDRFVHISRNNCVGIELVVVGVEGEAIVLKGPEPGKLSVTCAEWPFEWYPILRPDQIPRWVRPGHAVDYHRPGVSMMYHIAKVDGDAVALQRPGGRPLEAHLLKVCRDGRWSPSGNDRIRGPDGLLYVRCWREPETLRRVRLDPTDSLEGFDHLLVGGRAILNVGYDWHARAGERKRSVGSQARYALVAYAFLRGRAYARTEPNAGPGLLLGGVSHVLKSVGVEVSVEQITVWVNEGRTDGDV